MAARDELSSAMMKKDQEISRLKAQLKILVGGLVVGETPRRARTSNPEPSTPTASGRGTENENLNDLGRNVVVLEWDKEKHGSPPPPPTPDNEVEPSCCQNLASSPSISRSSRSVLAEWDRRKHGSPPPPPSPPKVVQSNVNASEDVTTTEKSAGDNLGRKKRGAGKMMKKKAKGKEDTKTKRRSKILKKDAARRPRTPLMAIVNGMHAK